MDLTTIIIIALVSIIDASLFYLIRRKLVELKKSQENHHTFLLKVKNDLPYLDNRVSELEDQILPPSAKLEELN